MRAVWWTKVGPPEVLVYGETPDPAPPGPGQVLVSVTYAGITFIETQLRAGLAPRPMLKPPAILGNGVGGTVIALGEGVDAGLLGQQVVTSTGGSGGYAALALARAADVIAVPEGVLLSDAVALLADGRTAVGLHQIAAVQDGETVLVEAAGGGVGSLLVQLALESGARVIAAASSQRKLESARELGAQVTLDYSAPDWVEELAKAAPDGVDVAFDGVGGAVGRLVFESMASGGRFVIHGLASGSVTDTSTPAREVTVIGMDQLSTIGANSRELAMSALAQAAAGRLRPVIGQRFALRDAAAAHAAIEARQTLGKTLLVVS
jgi:NADPH2:quinone reductase